MPLMRGMTFKLLSIYRKVVIPISSLAMGPRCYTSAPWRTTCLQQTCWYRVEQT
ncbi:hypothetical protein DPMN_131853 [Dreissena polymorpha]|uniref:Uncharacterized protein n=1 Tax=Dreissena polymorpha TaxID=45954 RepID=A0A9D4FRC8_DREPO|nr:hypothetical protein DPMN_131853 [Dreissena polymorpha]